MVLMINGRIPALGSRLLNHCEVLGWPTVGDAVLNHFFLTHDVASGARGSGEA